MIIENTRDVKLGIRKANTEYHQHTLTPHIDGW
jgi:hypothetical protein